jgi:hypothetical protein
MELFKRKAKPAKPQPMPGTIMLPVVQGVAESLEAKLRAEIRNCPTCGYQIPNPMTDRCPRCFSMVPLSEHTNCGECSHQGNCEFQHIAK